MAGDSKGVSARSARREVRNPILALHAAGQLVDLPRDAREALDALLADLAKDAAERAQKSWRQNKGPMAAYWKAVSVYAKHVRAAVRRAGRATSESATNAAGRTESDLFQLEERA